MTLLAFAASLVLMGVHAFTPALTRLPEGQQRILSSFAGGIGLTYVFLYLLFRLATGSDDLQRLVPLVSQPLETMFIFLWMAIVAAYLLYTWVSRSASMRDDHHVMGLFFLVYNLVAGAAVVQEARSGAFGLGLYTLALGLHLLSNERHLHHMCPEAHTRIWRWGLAVMPVIGCVLFLALPFPSGFGHLLLTLVAGATIISVIRQELPDPAEVRLPAFLAGTVGYALLLIATWRF